ncbi:hypothetical protein FB451DRAFT_1422161 [Mycena latifolia]|nr:hypothetical protein FB451DRAFT_1422161 [Mycena latifolia]
MADLNVLQNTLSAIAATLQQLTGGLGGAAPTPSQPAPSSVPALPTPSITSYTSARSQALPPSSLGHPVSSTSSHLASTHQPILGIAGLGIIPWRWIQTIDCSPISTQEATYPELLRVRASPCVSPYHFASSQAPASLQARHEVFKLRSHATRSALRVQLGRDRSTCKRLPRRALAASSVVLAVHTTRALLAGVGFSVQRTTFRRRSYARSLKMPIPAGSQLRVRELDALGRATCDPRWRHRLLHGDFPTQRLVRMPRLAAYALATMRRIPDSTRSPSLSRRGRLGIHRSMCKRRLRRASAARCVVLASSARDADATSATVSRHSSATHTFPSVAFEWFGYGSDCSTADDVRAALRLRAAPSSSGIET